MDKALFGWSAIFQSEVYILNQYLIRVTVSPITRIHESKDEEVEAGVAPIVTHLQHLCF